MGGTLAGGMCRIPLYERSLPSLRPGPPRPQPLPTALVLPGRLRLWTRPSTFRAADTGRSRAQTCSHTRTHAHTITHVHTHIPALTHERTPSSAARSPAFLRKFLLAQNSAPARTEKLGENVKRAKAGLDFQVKAVSRGPVEGEGRCVFQASRGCWEKQAHPGQALRGRAPDGASPGGWAGPCPGSPENARPAAQRQSAQRQA